jgi:N,N'-diacetylchitobiose non-reducing end deacetylase
MELKDIIPIPDLESCKSILCIQPHPDDNEVGAAATIAKLAANGCKVSYLTVIDGRNGSKDPNVDREALVETRRQEAIAAGTVLGATEFLFLDFPDGGYPDQKTLCSHIMGGIRKVKPEMIMTVDPYLPYEFHPDHRQVGMAVGEACIFSQFYGYKSEGRYAEEGSEPWEVKGLTFYATAFPNTIINVDSTWEKKFEALSMHKTQMNGEGFERLKMYFDFKARAYANGRGFERGEAFKVLSQDHLHVNVDTINL